MFPTMNLMTDSTTATISNAEGTRKLVSKVRVQAMLSDIAYVLQLTRDLKAEIIAEQAVNHAQLASRYRRTAEALTVNP